VALIQLYDLIITSKRARKLS